MKLRLMGTRDEINAVLPVLTAVLLVDEVSDFYPNKGRSRLGRVYLDVAGPALGSVVDTVRAEAVRADQPQPRTASEPSTPREISGGGA
jgi:hypothetical protein